MGLLSLGTPLPWNEAKKHANHVRKHGITQFLNVWNKVKGIRKDQLLWGDEIEYTIVNMDKNNKKARLALNASDVLDKLQKDENTEENYNASWKPEYAKYMIEGTPNKPYGSSINDLLTVERNMNERRQLIRQKLSPNEVVTSMTAFPTLGTPDFLYPSYNPTPCSGSSQSLFIPDQAITSHARFPTLTENIRKRRGSKVAINLPIYKDKNTPSPFFEPCPESLSNVICRHNLSKDTKKENNQSTANDCYPDYLSSGSDSESVYSMETSLNLSDLVPAAKPDSIYLDCMCFGMGCSCLQITFQACSVEEARKLYDLLAPVSPIMLAMTAGAPAYKGYLADTDCRWDVISGSVDDRTEEERGLKPLKDSRFRIKKSRYDSIDSYLSPGPQYSRNEQYQNVYARSSKIYYDQNGLPKCYSNISHYKPKYNDIELTYDKDIYNQLMANGVDDLLSKHIAHLFIRDPLVIFNELLDQDDTTSTDHFENIQSTNWQTLRFKPPPTNSNIGWRVEFRSMEIQLTDFANAAFSIFIVLLTRTIMSFNLNFYIPLSKVDENMKTAQVRDAAKSKKFWFRKHIIPKGFTNNEFQELDANREEDDEEDAYELMTLNEIFNGNPEKQFPGLISLVRSYLSSLRLDTSTYASLERYLFFISQRASGELKTDAAWIREFITTHEDYHQDSVVSPKIVYDLCEVLDGVNCGRQEDLFKIYDTVGVGIFGGKSVFSSDHINTISSQPFCDYYLTKSIPCIKCNYNVDNIEHSENCQKNKNRKFWENCKKCCEQQMRNYSVHSEIQSSTNAMKHLQNSNYYLPTSSTYSSNNATTNPKTVTTPTMSASEIAHLLEKTIGIGKNCNGFRGSSMLKNKNKGSGECYIETRESSSTSSSSSNNNTMNNNNNSTVNTNNINEKNIMYFR